MPKLYQLVHRVSLQLPASYISNRHSILTRRSQKELSSLNMVKVKGGGAGLASPGSYMTPPRSGADPTKEETKEVNTAILTVLSTHDYRTKCRSFADYLRTALVSGWVEVYVSTVASANVFSSCCRFLEALVTQKGRLEKCHRSAGSQ